MLRRAKVLLHTYILYYLYIWEEEQKYKFLLSYPNGIPPLLSVTNVTEEEVAVLSSVGAIYRHGLDDSR